MNSDWQPIKTSALASLPEFPLYSFLSKLEKLPSNSQKSLINHQYGVKDAKDILKAHQTTLDSLKKSAKDPSLSGYTHSCGLPKAREELAKYYSPKDLTLTADNIILFQGPDMAQNHLMRALCNPGDNFLIPSPSVGLWEETAPGYEFTCKKYRLLPEKQWEVDLEDLESKIDEKTRFIVVVNPSNPCGSVYSEAHLKQIVAVAEKYKLPIVADEGLEGVSFEGGKFVNLGHISGDVPVLQMGGLGDQYFAFGWNTSWVIMYDRIQVMTKFHKGLQAIMQLMLHAATFVSNVIPDVLDGPQQDYLEKEILPKVKKNADVVYEGLKKLDKYLEPIKAQGGFSMLVKLNLESFKDISSEEDFAEKLYTEENVILLPSTIYHWNGGVRIVTCLEEEVYPEFLQRIENFCKAHSK